MWEKSRDCGKAFISAAQILLLCYVVIGHISP
jgi:hypothetical protein